MANFKLVTDISKLGLLQSLARSRARLLFSTLCGFTITYGLGIWSARYIMETSTSVVANILLITANFFSILIVSYLFTVLIGDLTFPGPWRETVFLDRGPGDLERAPVNDHSGEFLVILILSVIANGVALNTINDGFLERYHEVGYFRVRLRAEKPQGRIAAFDELTQDMNYPLWEKPAVQKLILEGLDDPSAEVRAIAAWSAGKIDLQRARPKLIAMLKREEPPPVTAQTSVALGKLGPSPSARRAIEMVLSNTDHPKERLGALRGLGLMRSHRSVEPILPYLDSDDERVMLHAFWALRRIGSEKARPKIKAIIEGDPPKQKKCAAFDTFKKVASEKDILWARRRYQTGNLGEPCDEVVWRERDDTKHVILIGDSYREKLLKIVANEAARKHRDWFQRIVNDPQADSRLREVASEVIRQLRHAN